MHINELKTHPTLINSIIKDYELEWGLLRPIGQYQLPQNSFMKLTQYLTTNNQLHISILHIL